ncbi:hypothetical protein Tco_0863008 [Tanacetum coccineum]
MDEFNCSCILIKHMPYGAIHAENQDLFSTISELKTRLEKVEKGSSVVTTSDEQHFSNPLLTEADEFNQEDTADFDGNAQFVPYNPPSHEEIESSTTALEPSNVQNFHQIQPSTHTWIKDHPLDQKYGSDECVSMSTPMATERLDANLQGTPTDQRLIVDVKMNVRVHQEIANFSVKLVSWSSKKQDCTVMSTTEAEYVSLSACCAQVI